ncbi:hypothetical protein EO238_29665, partial [Citrobacter sp. AAK_AS5]
MDNYLNELFGWRKSRIETPREKTYGRGISVELKGAEEVGEEIVRDIELYRFDLMKKEILKKCSRSINLTDKNKCEIKV